MARGNQRDKARQANLKKQAAQVRPSDRDNPKTRAVPRPVDGGLRHGFRQHSSFC